MDWVILLTVFGILFLGELGDKTQLIVFNLTLEHDKSYKVGIGATLGFAVIVTIGVFFGTLITSYVPISLVSLISGIIFIILGIVDSFKIKKLYGQRKSIKITNQSSEEQNSQLEVLEDTIPPKFSKLRSNAYIAGFFFIFIMELGDKTQILTITLASIYPSLVEVWLGSFLALASLAWMGVFLGAVIARKVPKLHIKVVSIIIFITVGTITLITIFL
ncbi:MAG: TMEM165/GDT1 family protein [Promethearchaeota archaeon]|jgi:putative Ca2+/H+ antiporter (TMEM165/GDT1 family)